MDLQPSDPISVDEAAVGCILMGGRKMHRILSLSAATWRHARNGDVGVNVQRLLKTMLAIALLWFGFGVGTASGNVNVRVVLLADASGTPGSAIVDNTVAVDQPFFAAIQLQDQRVGGTGVSAFSAKVSWGVPTLQSLETAAGVTSPNSRLVTSQFPLFRSGSLDTATGVLSLAGGSLPSVPGLGAAIGAGQWDTFSTIHFQAGSTLGTVPLNLQLGDDGIAMADGATVTPTISGASVNVVPEPGGFALLAVALGLGAWRRKRRG